MNRDLLAGTDFSPVDLKDGVRAGMAICFESVFPYVARESVRRGANMLLVISNDAWYPTSNEPEQHFANALFRAVENRIPLLRCGNSSHTLWIDQCGIVRDTVLSNLHDRGRGQKVFTVQIPTEAPLTFYARFGNIFIILCGFFVFCAIVPAITNWNLFRLAQGEKS
jgi:apolipoprotein N-acyltransferase